LIDVTVPGTPGWWMQTLWQQLRAEQPRLNRLEAYRKGQPPIVMGSERLQSAFYRFQNMSRSNFADLIVSAMTNRMSLRSIRTAAAQDDSGDQAAWRIHTANGLDVGQTDLYRAMGTFGGGYVAIGSPDAPDAEPVITIEDPRQVTTAQDALRPMKSIAGFKLYHDVQAQMDYAILWIPGEKWAARRPRKARVSAFDQARGVTHIPVTFSASGFEMLPVGSRGDDGTIVWDADQPVTPLGSLAVVDPDTLAGYDGITSERYDLEDVPVVKFGNRDGVGEFELHTDLLDRIAHVILQQMVIATLQAFKQRAIELGDQPGAEGLPDEDEDGRPIDYNQVFEADPGALWRLPAGAKIWESGQVDLTGILSAAKDYILHLAATTQTPFPMFSPDSANQSANGASLYREGLTFKVEDRCRIAGAGWAQVYAIAFKLKGDDKRGAAADIIIDWAPADRYSLLEQTQADAQSSLPRAQKYARIYGMSPADVQVALTQASEEDAQRVALAEATRGVDPSLTDPPAPPAA
jgi:hypothetical protein